jgi:hypothetical protein
LYSASLECLLYKEFGCYLEIFGSKKTNKPKQDIDKIVKGHIRNGYSLYFMNFQVKMTSVLKLFVALAEFSSQTDTSVVGYGESSYPVIRPRQVR